ncbi:MAG: hypothetical protein CSB32_00510 [Desulfobacterales bacterium]|nr:MAG: hypothetical protein CSB32_00510 [Desulfobacterales bacterium]
MAIWRCIPLLFEAVTAEISGKLLFLKKKKKYERIEVVARGDALLKRNSLAPFASIVVVHLCDHFYRGGWSYGESVVYCRN